MNIHHPITARLRAGERAMAPFFESRPIEFSNFVLEHGRSYTAARLPKGLRRGKPGSCYENCAKFVTDPHNRTSGFRYAEGVALRPSSGLLVAHAWLVHDGEAFDPTWKDLSGGHNLDCLYFGVEFPTSVVGKILSARGYYGMLDPVDDLVRSEFSIRSQVAA